MSSVVYHSHSLICSFLESLPQVSHSFLTGSRSSLPHTDYTFCSGVVRVHSSLDLGDTSWISRFCLLISFTFTDFTCCLLCRWYIPDFCLTSLTTLMGDTILRPGALMTRYHHIHHHATVVCSRYTLCHFV